jgi:hypothetical protein
MKLSATLKKEMAIEYATYPVRPFEEEIKMMWAAGDLSIAPLLELHTIAPFSLTVSIETKEPPPDDWREQMVDLVRAATEYYLMVQQGQGELDPLDYYERRKFSLNPLRVHAQGLARSIIEGAKIEFSEADKEPT